MPRLIWSPAALRDVQRLHRYLAERNTHAARRTVKAIRNGVKMLQHQPQGEFALARNPGKTKRLI